MKKLTLFYLFLYITHVILGSHFYLDSYFININPFFIKIEKPKYINHIFDNLYNRIIWFTYLNYLIIAFFIEYPCSETFLIAFIISIISIFGYYYKFKHNPNEFQIGLIDHILFLLLPLIYLFFNYNINVFNYKPSIFSFIIIIYVIIYRKIDQYLYKNGKDL